MLTREATAERTPAGKQHRYVWLYLAVPAAAELLAAGTDPLLGLYFYTALLLLLLLRAQFLSGRERDFHVALAGVPLIRILSLMLPSWSTFPLDPRTLLAVPLGLSGLVAARVLGYNLIGSLRPRALLYLPLFALLGLLVGALGFSVLHPPALSASLNVGELFWPAFSLSFAALSEEVLFRGVLLTAAVGLLGPRQGVTLSAFFYASFFLGRQPWALPGFALLLSLGLGWLAFRTRSVVGVSLVHALAAITLFIVLPIALALLSAG